MSITLGEAIRNARKKKKMSQTELGKAVGCNKANISHIEKGRAYPRFRMLTKIADTLEIDISKVMDVPSEGSPQVGELQRSGR